MINVLIACEESQRVCTEFRKRGFNAYSCDIQECSGGHPEWHIKGDALDLINGFCTFTTMDGTRHIILRRWHLIIAHPPCTYLTVSANKYYDVSKYGEKAVQREHARYAAIEFFMNFINADCKHIAVENPIGIMSTRYRKPTQIIQPYFFGDNARKSTCLWLKGLPPLIADCIVNPGTITKDGQSVGASANYARDENGHILRWNDPLTSKIRSKTFPGIARAMAKQWGRYITEEQKI